MEDSTSSPHQRQHERQSEQRPQPPPPPSNRQRGRRFRIACARCHGRKIRCDASTPACGACVRSQVNCIYQGTLPGAISNEAGLQQRVQELEALLLRERESAEIQGSEPSTATPRGPDQGMTGRISVATPSRTAPRTEQYDPVDPGNSTLDTSAQNSGIPHSEAVPRTDLSHQVGLVSLSVGSDPRYVGPSSGYFFTKLLSSAGKQPEDRPPRSHEQGTSSRQQHERNVAMKAFQATQCSLPTDKKSARELSDAYFRTVHLVYPFLHKPTHQRLIEHVY